MKQDIKSIAVIFLSLIAYSCANIGSPNGGPYDEKPPRFISSKPAPNELNFKGKTIEILFDELIVLDKPSENVIITPPQIMLPVITAEGRKAVVELKDTLKSNTTYTIDFTNSIGDNNEKNVLENFAFAFSTGEALDSLEISGHLLSADNLEPVPGIIVGLHANHDDSAFVKEAFTRTSKTNDRGRFVIRNIAEGSYRIFALNDKNRDYKFDQPGEEIAFGDSIIIPSFEFTSRQDTIRKDSVTIDTILTVPYTRFTPDNIVLKLFKEKFERQYAMRHERSQANRLTLRFNAPLDSIPSPLPLNFTPADSLWYIPQRADGGVAIHYWITDSTVWRQDTLTMEITYPASDSLNVLRPVTDTVSLSLRPAPRSESRRRRTDEEKAEPPAVLQLTVKGVQNRYDTVSVLFDEPVAALSPDMFRFEQKADTIWQPVDFELMPDTANPLNFFIMRKWGYGESYRIEVDSAAVTSIYGRGNDAASVQFAIKARDEYGHLYVNVEGLPDGAPAFGELVDNGDRPVRKVRFEGGGLLFMDLPPASYGVRLTVDLNDNFMWDTGNYAGLLQPETVYYYHKIIEIKRNWEIEENWNLLAQPFTRQKPIEITKNKPKEITKPVRDYRNEGRQQSSRGSSSNPLGRSMPF
ncbi:MAG: Ig-like domain-containing protein [Tannerellaceae bacterium]|jgi:hypothetical protein|nr:Ig-like domain-containing protein [Tannerellaceae bacterium]